jgi:hypothetical protein
MRVGAVEFIDRQWDRTRRMECGHGPGRFKTVDNVYPTRSTPPIYQAEEYDDESVIPLVSCPLPQSRLVSRWCSQSQVRLGYGVGGWWGVFGRRVELSAGLRRSETESASWYITLEESIWLVLSISRNHGT